MGFLSRRFVTGLLILLPAVVTGWVLYKSFITVDNFIAPIQQRYPIIDIPGLGFVIVIFMVLLTGVFAGNFIGRRVIARGERVLYKLPIIRRIYVAVKELSEVFLSDRKSVFKRVVIIPYPHPNSYALAFVTQDTSPGFTTIVGRRMVNVFVPTTPNPTSGFLLFVPEEDVQDLPIDVEEGLKLVISGGVFTPAPLSSSR